MDHAILPAIVIAAGGEGRRMGGAKPQQMLAGRALIDHACTWALSHGGPCAIAVRDAGQVAANALPTSVPVLIDENSGIGPVSALLNAMRFARAHRCEAVMLIGCDQPFLPHDLPAQLMAAIGGSAVAMPVSGGKDQPLASLWRLRERQVADFIARGARSLWRLADELGAHRVEWPSTDAQHDPFANINDPASLARIAAITSHKGRAPCA